MDALEVHLLSQMVGFPSFLRMTNIPSHINPFQHLLSLLFLIIDILTSVRWYLFVVSICIALMMSDVEHLFMYSLTICMSSLEKMSIQDLCPFLIGLFFFLLLNYMSSLYILDINPLSDTWFANIFSHFVRWLFILLIAYVGFCLVNQDMVKFWGASIPIVKAREVPGRTLKKM